MCITEDTDDKKQEPATDSHEKEKKQTLDEKLARDLLKSLRTESIETTKYRIEVQNEYLKYVESITALSVTLGGALTVFFDKDHKYLFILIIAEVIIFSGVIYGLVIRNKINDANLKSIAALNTKQFETIKSVRSKIEKNEFGSAIEEMTLLNNPSSDEKDSKVYPEFIIGTFIAGLAWILLSLLIQNNSQQSNELLFIKYNTGSGQNLETIKLQR